ncbi:hypothetical protein BURMUCF2_B0418 [Burkholderia multivorans CF2]|nr:hypothetical protein BURMUCF2_B0418 [Burkholderia multivorans CF2]
MSPCVSSVELHRMNRVDRRSITVQQGACRAYRARARRRADAAVPSLRRQLYQSPTKRFHFPSAQTPNGGRPGARLLNP